MPNLDFLKKSLGLDNMSVVIVCDVINFEIFLKLKYLKNEKGI